MADLRLGGEEDLSCRRPEPDIEVGPGIESEILKIGLIARDLEAPWPVDDCGHEPIIDQQVIVQSTQFSNKEVHRGSESGIAVLDQRLTRFPELPDTNRV